MIAFTRNVEGMGRQFRHSNANNNVMSIMPALTRTCSVNSYLHFVSQCNAKLLAIALYRHFAMKNLSYSDLVSHVTKLPRS